jgi:hypothetical protein
MSELFASFLNLVPLIGSPALQRSPRYRYWVFRTGNFPIDRYRLTVFQRLTPFYRVRGLPPPTCLLSTSAPRHVSRDPRPFALASFMSSIPRSDSWHRIGQNFAHRLYLHLPHGGSRSKLVFAVFRRVSRRCHTISTLPSALDDTRSPWVTDVSSPPCRPHTPGCDEEEPNAFASLVQARPFLVFGRPVHLWDSSLRLRPGGSPQALQTPPRDGRPALRLFRCELSATLGRIRRFQLRARLEIGLSTFPGP